MAKRRQQFDDARANLQDVRAFLDAAQQLAEVELWLDARLAELNARADERRTACRRQVTKALAGMTARGMAAEEIAWMTGMAAKSVRAFLENPSQP